MIHFVIDLDDRIKTLLLKDDTIIELREADYINDTLSILKAQLSDYNVDKVTVITHNFVSACIYSNSCVAFEADFNDQINVSSVNLQDMQVIKALTDECNIHDVRFVDKIGYFYSMGNRDTCYVDQQAGMYRLICVQDGLRDYMMCSQTILDQRLKDFCEKNNLQRVVYEKDLTDVDNLMFFTNASMVLDDPVTVHDLSVFAYACMDADLGSCSYGFEVMENSTDAIVSVAADVAPAPVEETVEVDDLEDALNSEIAELDRTRKVHKLLKRKPHAEPKEHVEEPRDLKKSKISAGSKVNDSVDPKLKLISTIALVLGIIGFIVTGMLIVGSAICHNKLNAATKQLAEINNNVTNAQQLVDVYNYCLNTGENKAFDLLASCDSAITENSGELQKIILNDDGVALVVKFSDDDSYNNFINYISSSISNVKYSELQNDSGDGSHTVQLSGTD